MKKKLITIIPLTIFLIVLAIFIKDIIEIVPTIFKGETEITEVLLKEFGWRGVIYLIIIQACEMLLVFLPSEPIQVISGATYGIFYGTLVCWTGLILGATIIYLLVNVFKQDVKSFHGNSNSEEIIKALNQKNKSAFFITLILFFLPAVPYGVICYFASGTNMKYPKYILSCLIGVLPSVLLDSLFGRLAINSIGKYMWPLIIGFVFLMILFLWLVKAYTNKKVNKLLYGSSKPEIETKLNKRKINNPDSKLYRFLKRFLSRKYIKQNNVVCENHLDKISSPYILLSAHPSKQDFIYNHIAVGKNANLNIICNRYYFNFPILYKIFDKLGVISKKMFTSDTTCIKDIMKVSKDGGNLLMMPEGRLSINGTNLQIPFGLGKLLKKLKIPVYGVIPHGAYLSGAKWMKVKHTGMVEIETKTILLPDELETLTTDEIEQKCIDALKFDDFEWLKTKNITFKSKNLLKGIDGILYHCPHCHSEFNLVGDKNKIICTNCNSETIMNNRYEFENSPAENIKNIRDWYNYQVKIESERVKNADFEITCDVTAKTYNKFGKGLDTISDGKCKLNKNGLFFESNTDSTLNASVNFDTLKTLLFGCNEDFETYIDDKFYFFIPKGDKRICVKWAICSEEMHKYLEEENTQSENQE